MDKRLRDFQDKYKDIVTRRRNQVGIHFVFCWRECCSVGWTEPSYRCQDIVTRRRNQVGILMCSVLLLAVVVC